MANGRPNAVWNMITPKVVSKIPMVPKSSETGISATCTGTTSRPTTTRNHQSRPGNSIQAKAYPASEPITTTRNVVGTVISTVLSSESVMTELSSRRW